MYTYTIKKSAGNRIDISVLYPQEDITTELENTLSKQQATVKLKGFRQGKAPAPLARIVIDPNTTYNRMIQTIAPKLVNEIIKEEDLRPFIRPQIDLEPVEEEKPWKFTISFVTTPSVDIKNYKDIVENAKKSAEKEIAELEKTPVEAKEDELHPQESKEAKEKQVVRQAIAKALAESNLCELDDMVAAEDVAKRITELEQMVGRMGVTLEDYLTSKKTTLEEVRKNYTKELLEGTKLALILDAIAQAEDIKNDEAEHTAFLDSQKTPLARKYMEDQLAAMLPYLLRERTLDFLAKA